MNPLQLDFIMDDETAIEIKIKYMQKEINDIRESSRKCIKKLFCINGEISKTCLQFQNEIQELKRILKGLTNEKTEWVYGQENCLFNVQEHREPIR